MANTYAFHAVAVDIDVPRILEEALSDDPDVLAVVVRIPDDTPHVWRAVWCYTHWVVAVRDFQAFCRAGFDGNYQHCRFARGGNWTAISLGDGDPREKVAELVTRVRAARAARHCVEVTRY